MQLKAEVIAIGDELTSGQRLDTNTQWLSQQLGELGISVAFHTTVGDDLQDNVDVFRIAGQRADIVIATGGLGPTADDLTRQAIADAANIELEFHSEVLEHIELIFKRYGREMPENNRVQAYFPAGSRIVDNPEGTAPGVDFDFPRKGKDPSRMFALPGVPAEMKQMWEATVQPALKTLLGDTQVIHHHVLHCFGVGESQAETMLPHLIKRGREPRVGITASAATISFRVTARGETTQKCIAQIQPTLDEVRQVMGSFVFGENGQQLEDVVHAMLVGSERKVAIVDCGLNGDVAQAMLKVAKPSALAGSLAMEVPAAARWFGNDEFDLASAAARIRSEFGVDIGIAVGKIEPSGDDTRPIFQVAFDSDKSVIGCNVAECRHGGHSSFRQARSVKQVLNHLRLLLERHRV